MGEGMTRIDTIAKYRAAVRQATTIYAEAGFGDRSFTVKVRKVDALDAVKGESGKTTAAEMDFFDTIAFWHDHEGGVLVIG